MAVNTREWWISSRRRCVGAMVLTLGCLLGGCQFFSAPTVQDRWDFSDGDTTQWTSPNAEVVAFANGVGLTPREEPAVLVSGPLSLDRERYQSVRVSLFTQRPAEGRFGLVVQAAGGVMRVSLPFKTRGGRMETLDLELSGVPPGVLKQAIIVPSLVPQPVAVGSVRFAGGWQLPWLEEVVSPKPGINLALKGYSINFVQPPSFNGRSLWQWLFPLVLGLAIAVFGLQGTVRWRAMLRARAMQGLVAIWALGVCFLIYHQSVALSVDAKRYGGLSLEEAYQRMDGGPFWRDLRAVSSFTTPRDSIELVLHVEESRGQFLRFRAAYYLAPAPLRQEDATLRLHYFADVHAPCATVEPDLVLLEESRRVCLFRVRAA